MGEIRERMAETARTWRMDSERVFGLLQTAADVHGDHGHEEGLRLHSDRRQSSDDPSLSRHRVRTEDHRRSTQAHDGEERICKERTLGEIGSTHLGNVEEQWER